MKEALLALELEDASADSLKSLLLTCFIHPTYIKSQEVSPAVLHREDLLCSCSVCDTIFFALKKARALWSKHWQSIGKALAHFLAG